MTREEWRARREARRARQRAENVDRAARMHAARLACEVGGRPTPPTTAAVPAAARVHVGCSGWFYWHWPGGFYPLGLPTGDWFAHYAGRFRTVELNAPFYSWPTVATVNG